MMCPAFAAVRRGEKMHAREPAARDHHNRQCAPAVAQPLRNEIFDVSLASEHLLLIVENLLEIAGVLGAGLSAIDNATAGPEDSMVPEHKRQALLVSWRVGAGLRQHRQQGRHQRRHDDAAGSHFLTSL
jgi:hypothetical protein